VACIQKHPYASKRRCAFFSRAHTHAGRDTNIGGAAHRYKLREHASVPQNVFFIFVMGCAALEVRNIYMKSK
jgi:hypothetical protein